MTQCHAELADYCEYLPDGSRQPCYALARPERHRRGGGGRAGRGGACRTLRRDRQRTLNRAPGLAVAGLRRSFGEPLDSPDQWILPGLPTEEWDACKSSW